MVPPPPPPPKLVRKIYYDIPTKWVVIYDSEIQPRIVTLEYLKSALESMTASVDEVIVTSLLQRVFSGEQINAMKQVTWNNDPRWNTRGLSEHIHLLYARRLMVQQSYYVEGFPSKFFQVFQFVDLDTVPLELFGQRIILGKSKAKSFLFLLQVSLPTRYVFCALVENSKRLRLKL